MKNLLSLYPVDKIQLQILFQSSCQPSEENMIGANSTKDPMTPHFILRRAWFISICHHCQNVFRDGTNWRNWPPGRRLREFSGQTKYEKALNKKTYRGLICQWKAISANRYDAIRWMKQTICRETDKRFWYIGMPTRPNIKTYSLWTVRHMTLIQLFNCYEFVHCI